MNKTEYIAVIEQNNNRAKKRLSSSVKDMKDNPSGDCHAHVHVIHNAEAMLGGFETLLDNQLLQAQYQVNGSVGWSIDCGPIKIKGRTLADGLLIMVMLILIAVHYKGFEEVEKKLSTVESVVQEVAE